MRLTEENLNKNYKLLETIRKLLNSSLVLLVPIFYKLPILGAFRNLDSLLFLKVLVWIAAKSHAEDIASIDHIKIIFNILMAFLVNTRKERKKKKRKWLELGKNIQRHPYLGIILFIENLNIIKIQTIRVRDFHIFVKFKIRHKNSLYFSTSAWNNHPTY